MARAWFEQLRDRICAAFEAIEDDYAGGTPMPTCRRAVRAPALGPAGGGGGGVIAIMRGRVFEKVGVNVSTVWGEFSPEFRSQMPGAEADGRFWASGISLVAHLRSPHVPPAHMNTRHIRTSQSLVRRRRRPQPDLPGRGRHRGVPCPAASGACDAYAPDAYERFKTWADEYFFIPHRGEARGVGGIFYDYLEGDFARHLAFTQAVGEAFLDIYPSWSAGTWTGPGPRPSASTSWSGAAAMSSST